jgi:hypothetical protein
LVRQAIDVQLIIRIVYELLNDRGFEREANPPGPVSRLFSIRIMLLARSAQSILEERRWQEQNLTAEGKQIFRSFQADRSPDHCYRTSPLQGLWTHTKGGFYHDGRFATLLDVVDHYDTHFGLGLSDDEKSDLVEYLKSLGAGPRRDDDDVRKCFYMPETRLCDRSSSQPAVGKEMSGRQAGQAMLRRWVAERRGFFFVLMFSRISLKSIDQSVYLRKAL